MSGGHSYEWHDGRLHALAAVALPPGVSFVGRWRIPVRIDGQLSSISGGLWHADSPSIVWFWPIVVLLACVLAAWRLRRPALDRTVARVLALTALVSVTIAGLGLQLHGRPTITPFQFVELAAILAFVGWGFSRTLFRQPGYFTCFLIGVAALWAGGEMITTLLYGFVLIPLPAFLARTATIVCLGTGAGLLLLVFRLADLGESTPAQGRQRLRSSRRGHAGGVMRAVLTVLRRAGGTRFCRQRADPPGRRHRRPRLRRRRLRRRSSPRPVRSEEVRVSSPPPAVPSRARAGARSVRATACTSRCSPPTAW